MKSKLLKKDVEIITLNALQESIKIIEETIKKIKSDAKD